MFFIRLSKVLSVISLLSLLSHDWMQYPKFPYNLAILHLSIYPKVPKTRCRKDIFISVHCSTSHNSQNMITIQVPKNILLNKEAMVHLHNRILLDCRKFAESRIILENIILSEVSQRKNKHKIISLIYGI